MRPLAGAPAKTKVPGNASGRAPGGATGPAPSLIWRVGRQSYQNTFLGALYRRWVRRMPMKKVIIALAHRLLIIVYHVLVTGEPYQDLGPAYHDERDRTQIVHRTVRRLEKLGYRVTVEPTEPLPATG